MKNATAVPCPYKAFILKDGEFDYAALVESVRFCGKHLSVKIIPPVLKITEVTKIAAGSDIQQKRCDVLALVSNEYEFDLTDTKIEQDEFGQVLTCTTSDEKIVVLSERMIDQLRIKRFFIQETKV